MQDILTQANRYRVRAHRKARSHYLTGKLCHAKHIRLGVPVMITTTVVGTTIFARLSEAPNTHWQITTGLLSIAAAVLAALQTFFRYSEAAEKHRATGAGFAALHRKLDLFLVKYHEAGENDRLKAIDELQSVLDDYNQLEANSLDVPDSLYDQAVNEQQADKEGV